MSISTTVHVPVLIQPILEFAAAAKPHTIFDGTLGGGGHALLLAKLLPCDGWMIATDQDPAAVEAFQACLKAKALGPQWSLRKASYHELPLILSDLGMSNVDLILLDLGISSDQLADNKRGFSFKATGDFDLRFDSSSGRPAWEVLHDLSEREIADILWKFGEERYSRRIARQLCQTRQHRVLRTSEEYRDLISRCVPRDKNARIDPATRSFQAVRIYVNGELDNLATALESLPKVLSIGGIFQIISFHSLEDRMVKNAFRDCLDLEILTRKPISASESEISQNPRSRSAKLRIARRIEVSEENRNRVRSLAEYQRHSHF